MSTINDTGKKQIRDAIQAAEKLSSGEFVTVIAKRSDDYQYIPILWAALAALLLPGLLALIAPVFAQHYAYLSQVTLFFVLMALFQWQPLKMILIPATVKTRRASQYAQMQFHAQGLRNTKARTGVLLFVSLAERYVEIIADQGINEKLPAGTWDDIVNTFIVHVKNGQITEGFVDATQRCGKVLQQHFPRTPNDNDELTNRLIEI